MLNFARWQIWGITLICLFGVLFTEHSMDVVFAYADRMAVLARGRMIAEGRPAEIRDHPKVQEVYFGTGKTFEAAAVQAVSKHGNATSNCLMANVLNTTQPEAPANLVATGFGLTGRSRLIHTSSSRRAATLVRRLVVCQASGRGDGECRA